MLLRRTVLAVMCALGVGCGTLENPDLQHGAVTGRIPNASTGAYAYVLGSPQLLVAADADGTFRLDGVPAGATTIVLYDGSAGAEGLALHVDGAAISHLDPGRPLKAAAALTIGQNPAAGTKPTGLAVTVAGTPLQQVSAAAGAARLYPLPAGTFTVSATQPGFDDKRIDVALEEGSEHAVEIDLPVKQDDQRRGCVSCGCDKGLSCNPDDGRCYECVTNDQCGAGGTCTTSHVCSRPAGAGLLCEACTVGSDCQGTHAACVNATGGTLTGFCSLSCSGVQDCPSGFDCRSGACAPPASCLGVVATYGSPCTDDTGCASTLKDGKCWEKSKDTVGYCTARAQLGCPAGFVVDPAGSGYCVTSP